MKCPKCQTENPDNAKFCIECGKSMEFHCPECGATTAVEGKFCMECGHDLKKSKKTTPVSDFERTSSFPKPPVDKPLPVHAKFEGERKYVTVLFSDMSGYTAMSERLDPEEVKEITSRIFGEISQIVIKYDGFIEKFIGDAVMAVFGATKAFEDDPIRAIKATREIHRLVKSLSPKYEKTIGQPLSMHTGINTGLVVTGEVNLEKGTHGMAGDAINLAARLSGLGKEGDILVGPDTYAQAEGYFDFETLEPVKVKGKSKATRVYRVLAQKGQPRKVHRLQGVRAKLIGRKVETALLGEAVDNLWKGNGSTIAVCGTAGTGKSRLIEEFKATLDLEEIQWQEGHAYPYAKNTPYFPLINLLSRAFQIEEGDVPERMRKKVEDGIGALLGKTKDVVPYVGSLYSLNYPEIENVSAESWKSKIQKAIQSILSALAQRGPTVICLEDLHWADPSFLELLRLILSDSRVPILLICIYRPTIALFTSHQIQQMANPYNEIRLQDLSTSESQDMVESLLNTEDVPPELRQFVQEKVEGNPFYLEEVTNSLIESKTLVNDSGRWKVTRPITETDISSTIHGVISARLDRLEKETKRILQEASVIGRAFLFEILKKITVPEQDIDRSIRGLEQLDLIRAKTLEPDLEYIFKHALTQEVVYNGLLKKERKEIHERIGLVMEQLFQDRLSEFYETLSFHFKQGLSVRKAVYYLIKSAEKSLNRFSLEESHLYFKESFDHIRSKPIEKREEKALLFDLLAKWAEVYHLRGGYRELIKLLKSHENLASSIDDKSRLSMFYGWLGFALGCRNEFKDAYLYLCKALKLAGEAEDLKAAGYVYGWLTIICSELGLLDDAVAHGKRAEELSNVYKSDPGIFEFSSFGNGLAYFIKGESKKLYAVSKWWREEGRELSDIRYMAWDHFAMGVGHLADGNFLLAIEYFQKAIQLSIDPILTLRAKLMLGLSYLSEGLYAEAESFFDEVVEYDEKFGAEIWGTSAKIARGLAYISKGNLSEGVKICENGLEALMENGSKYRYATFQFLLGNVYLQVVERSGPKSLAFFTRNIGFLLKNIPVAGRKAEDHFNEAILMAKEIGAKGVLGQSYMALGLLNKRKRRQDKARQFFSEAVDAFEQCGAKTHLKRAKEALESLG